MECFSHSDKLIWYHFTPRDDLQFYHESCATKAPSLSFSAVSGQLQRGSREREDCFEKESGEQRPEPVKVLCFVKKEEKVKVKEGELLFIRN